MKEDITISIYFIVATALTILSIFLLSLTKITLDDFLTINVFPLIEKTMTMEFLLFLFLIPLIITIYYIISTTFEIKKAFLIIIPSWLIGTLIGLILFNLMEFILLFLITTIGIFLLVRENDKENAFSTGFSFSKKFTLLFSIGLFLTILSITLPNATEFEENFSIDILETTIGSEDENLRDMIETPLIESIILTQEQTIQSIKNLPSYQSLKQKQDVDVQLFTMQIKSMQDIISSQEYRDELEVQRSSMQGLSEQITKDLPIINNLARFSWILYPTFAFILAISMFGIIIQIITAIFYVIIKKLNQVL